MYQNNVRCDLYIGTGADKKLMQEIRNAKKSVKVVSPFVSEVLIKKLISLHESGIEINLITSADSILNSNGSYKKVIYDLIVQNKIIDKQADETRKRWSHISKILSTINIGLVILLISLIFLMKDFRLILLTIPIIILALIIAIYKNEIKSKRVFTYTYSVLLPLKIFIRSESNDHSYVHSKIYLIDDEIVYLGSLNFTVSGTQHNYETRIRTTDSETVNKIREELNDLINNSDLTEKDIQSWGKKLYREPIN